MKIGILTFHYGSNYGGVLQCYALQETIKRLGIDVQVINYRPRDSFKQALIVILTCIKRNRIKSFKKIIFYLTHKRISKNVFLEFTKKFLNQTQLYHNISKVSKHKFDTIIVGSDQIWNISQQNKKTYFLGWIKDKSTKRISYAACCGQNLIRQDRIQELKQQLNSFDAISVRGKETQKFVYDLIGKRPIIVSDPVMLYSFSEFVTKTNEKYILTYILGNDTICGNAKVIHAIKNKYPNIPVYSICISDRVPNEYPYANKIFNDISPQLWVNMIYNCSILYTDSYHGAIFAMKFRKPLVAYYNNSTTGKRFEDLAETFNMKNILTSKNSITEILNNNFENTYSYSSKVSQLNIESLSYLRNSIIK